MSDDLLSRVQRGEHAAFEEIFRTWYSPLVRMVDGVVRSQAVAEELVQDVLLELWRRRDRLDPSLRAGEGGGGSVAAYLFQSARNRALNHVRHGRVVDRSVPLLVVGDRPRAAPADDAIAIDELAAAIHAAVASLPPRCREVFELSRRDGLRYAEIAERLGVTIKAVEAQMGRALRTMRERLAPWLPPGETM